jgi:hypothetical protein
MPPKLTYPPSDHLPVSAPSQRGRRHPAAALLPILSCRDCHHDVWSSLLGRLETGAAIRLQIPLGSYKGGARRRDRGYASEFRPLPLRMRD